MDDCSPPSQQEPLVSPTQTSETGTPLSNNNIATECNNASTDVNDNSISNVCITQTIQPTSSEHNQFEAVNSSNANSLQRLMELRDEHTHFEVPVNANELVPCYSRILGSPKFLFPFSCQCFTDLTPHICKFKDRGCLVRTWNLGSRKVQEEFISSCKITPPEPTCFPVPKDKVKNTRVFMADTKLIICSNTSCNQMDDDGEFVPTYFHYCCYVNMRMKLQFKDLEYKEHLDKFGSFSTKVIEKLSDKLVDKDVILPVCSKKCYNVMLRKRKAAMKDNEKSIKNMTRKKDDSNNDTTTNTRRWDMDSRNGSKTSEQVIVHWLIDEENAKKYFGGSHGLNNRTIAGEKFDEMIVEIA